MLQSLPSVFMSSDNVQSMDVDITAHLFIHCLQEMLATSDSDHHRIGGTTAIAPES